MKQESKEPVKPKMSAILFKRMPKMVSDYEQLMKYTGGYLSKSMASAYNKALNDVLKLIMKEEVKANESTGNTEQSSESTSA